ncbi:unnamed protein product [Schistosoma curassoni]|uniref:Uncharacterized protein n=1 Tax=Schistosoma curassoni TaxID=6186 RepID=A0A183L2X5_9TREM|nr:unnamed protein product [Schistosoma curassoni]
MEELHYALLHGLEIWKLSNVYSMPVLMLISQILKNVLL